MIGDILQATLSYPILPYNELGEKPRAILKECQVTRNIKILKSWNSQRS